MDQDFHYYGTYYAAQVSRFGKADANLIALAANFIDFLSETAYGGYWKLIHDDARKVSGFLTDSYAVIGEVTCPRYTFQAGKASAGGGPEDGLWCSYHFPPGNFADPEAPTIRDVHGEELAHHLPNHEVRALGAGVSAAHGRLLNRPLSPLSRLLIKDTIDRITKPGRLEQILRQAVGNEALFDRNKTEMDKLLHRFGLILLGVRAHVLADTWAHQDFAGISHDVNTYYDVKGELGRQSIDYVDVGGRDNWKNIVLDTASALFGNSNFESVPSGTSYLGHGWMGHFPDYSFVKFRYKPHWAGEKAAPLVRNNPVEYHNAFLELCSLLSQCHKEGRRFSPGAHRRELALADAAIEKPCDLSVSSNVPRWESAMAWDHYMPQLGFAKPTRVNTKLEPDEPARMTGLQDSSIGTFTRYGDYFVRISSDLYLFQIAVDYHFHTVKRYLLAKGIRTFEGSWSQEVAALVGNLDTLFAPQVVVQPPSVPLASAPKRPTSPAPQTPPSSMARQRSPQTPPLLLSQEPPHPRAPKPATPDPITPPSASSSSDSAQT